MKLRNKKTGEVANVRSAIGEIEPPQSIVLVYNNLRIGTAERKSYTSLDELNEEWEDYEEPKEFWAIENGHGQIVKHTDVDNCFEDYKKLGNDFETKGEAEKAVEKLKAWKRLKDEGWRSTSYIYDEEHGIMDIRMQTEKDSFLYKADKGDLDLLFKEENV